MVVQNVFVTLVQMHQLITVNLIVHTDMSMAPNLPLMVLVVQLVTV